MAWICGNCGKEHPASRTTCKRCGSREIDYAARKTNTISVVGSQPDDPLSDIEYESSPDVKSDGSMESQSNQEVEPPSKMSHYSQEIARSTRSEFYRIRGFLLSPLHIIWMYKQAILAFLLVFGGVLFLL